MAEENLGIDFFAKLAGFNKLTNAANKVNRLKKTAEKATGALARFNQAALKVGQVGKGMQAWGGKMMMQTGLVYQAAQDLSRKFHTVVDAFASVETKGKELGMVLEPIGGNIKKSIDLATQSALDFSKKYSSSATEIMEAQYLIASAGITKPLITTKAAEWTIKLAKATREGVSSAANIWANAANTFFDAANMTEGEMKKLSDTLTRTQQKFQFENLFQLGDGLSYTGAAARELNISIESTATLLGTLNTAGIQGSMAGTSLQQTFLKLNKIQKKLKLEFKYTKDGSLDIVDAFRQLKATMQGMSSQAKTLYLQQLFGDRAFKSVATIISKIDQVEKDLLDVSSAVGVTERSFEDMEHTTRAAFARIRNNMFKLFYIIGKKLGPALVKLSGYTVKIINKITEFADKHPIITKLVGAFLGVGAAIAGIMIPLMTFIGIFTWGMGSIISLVGGISGGIAALLPILAVIGIALAVIAQLAATIFIAWKIGKWLSKLELGGKTLREWVRHLLKITIFSEAFRKIIDKIIKIVKKIAPPVAFAAAFAIAMPTLLSIAVILGYIASLVAVAFSAYKIGKWLGALKFGSRTLGEWISKLLKIIIFIERVKLAIIKVLGGALITNTMSGIKTIMDKLILTAKIATICFDTVFTGIRRQIVGAFTLWKIWIEIIMKPLQTCLNILGEWSRSLFKITLFGNNIKKVFNKILDIVLKITAPLRRLAKVRIIQPIKEELKKTQRIGGLSMGGSIYGFSESPTPEKTEFQKTLDKIKSGAAAFSPGGVGISSPKDITAATRPEIKNYYYTTHFERDSVQINTAELSPEKFITLLEEVIRRKALVNEPA